MEKYFVEARPKTSSGEWEQTGNSTGYSNLDLAKAWEKHPAWDYRYTKHVVEVVADCKRNKNALGEYMNARDDLFSSFDDTYDLSEAIDRLVEAVRRTDAHDLYRLSDLMETRSQTARARYYKELAVHLDPDVKEVVE